MAKINLGDGLMEMDTIPLSTAGRTLAGNGGTFAEKWKAVAGQITTHEPGIGLFHEQSRLFRPGYTTSAKALNDAVASIVPVLTSLAEGIPAAIALYDRTDTEHARKIRNTRRK